MKKFELIVGTKLHRNAFVKEFFSDSDDILMVVQKGSFVCKGSPGMENEIIGEADAYCFKQGEHYERHVIEPLDIFLFRYTADEQIFPNGKITFQNQERIRSTMEIFDSVVRGPMLDFYACAKTVCEDIILQYRAENANTYQVISSDPIVEKTKKFLEESVKEKVNFEELGKGLGLSYTQFLRRFKAATNLLPSDYLHSLRMKKAITLLESTTLSVKKIAEECGFYDEYYFSNRFKQYTNVSPTQYRNNCL